MAGAWRGWAYLRVKMATARFYFRSGWFLWRSIWERGLSAWACDYVDGRIEERKLGEYERSRVQHMLDRIFGNTRTGVGGAYGSGVPVAGLVWVNRFRVPADVMVVRRGQR